MALPPDAQARMGLLTHWACRAPRTPLRTISGCDMALIGPHGDSTVPEITYSRRTMNKLCICIFKRQLDCVCTEDIVGTASSDEMYSKETFSQLAISGLPRLGT